MNIARAARISLGLAMLLLTGCQAMMYGTASDFDQLHRGMSKADVIKILGAPISIEANADTGQEILIYKRMERVISDWPRLYGVTFREGAMVRYGEWYSPSVPPRTRTGTAMSVETMPGVRFFSGDVSGSAIEVMPGVTQYNFNSVDNYADELATQSERDYARRRALEQEAENRALRERLDRIEKQLRDNADRRP